MSANQPFSPKYGSNQSLTAAAGSQSASIDGNNKQVRIINTGTNVAYVRVGTGSVTATAADFPVPGGSGSTISKGDGENVLAYVSPTGTTLHVMTGEGY